MSSNGVTLPLGSVRRLYTVLYSKIWIVHLQRNPTDKRVKYSLQKWFSSTEHFKPKQKTRDHWQKKRWSNKTEISEKKCFYKNSSSILFLKKEIIKPLSALQKKEKKQQLNVQTQISRQWGWDDERWRWWSDGDEMKGWRPGSRWTPAKKKKNSWDNELFHKSPTLVFTRFFFFPDTH